MVVEFIDDHRDRFGVAPICRVLTEHGVPIAPSTYRAFRTRPAAARSTSDAGLLVQILVRITTSWPMSSRRTEDPGLPRVAGRHVV